MNAIGYGTQQHSHYHMMIVQAFGLSSLNTAVYLTRRSWHVQTSKLLDLAIHFVHTRQCLLVIRLWCIRVRNDIVWGIRPKFDLLSRTVPHALQHFVWIHVLSYSELTLFWFNFHLCYSFHAFQWFLHLSLTPFTTHLHFYLHYLIHHSLIFKLCLTYK
jgi:hypothetical protein